MTEKRVRKKSASQTLTRAHVVGLANGRLREMRARFKDYTKSIDDQTGVSRSHREYKKTINVTLTDIHELMSRLRGLEDSKNPATISKIHEELEECFTILDSCLRSLDAGIKAHRLAQEKNILCLEYHLFSRRRPNRMEIRYVVGTHGDTEVRERPRIS